MPRQNAKIVWIITAVIAVFVVPRLVRRTRNHSDTIDYQGQTIRLSKSYSDYDDYKNDPDNIAKDETDRVMKMVREAKAPRTIRGRREMITAVSQLVFPGYGMTSFGEHKQADGGVLSAFSIEIPRAEQERVLVYRGQGDTYTLIDDFLIGEDQSIEQVKEQDGKLIYSTRKNQATFAHTPATQP